MENQENQLKPELQKIWSAVTEVVYGKEKEGKFEGGVMTTENVEEIVDFLTISLPTAILNNHIENKPSNGLSSFQALHRVLEKVHVNTIKEVGELYKEQIIKASNEAIENGK